MNGHCYFTIGQYHSLMERNVTNVTFHFPATLGTFKSLTVTRSAPTCHPPQTESLLVSQFSFALNSVQFLFIKIDG